MKKRIKLLLSFLLFTSLVLALSINASALYMIEPGDYYFKDSIPFGITLTGPKELGTCFILHLNDGSNYEYQGNQVYSSGAPNAADLRIYNNGYGGWGAASFSNTGSTRYLGKNKLGIMSYVGGYITILKPMNIVSEANFNSVFKSVLYTANISIEYITTDTALISWNSESLSNVVGYVLYRNGVVYQRLAAEISEVSVNEYGAYQLSVLYAGSAPEDPDQESDLSNTVEFVSHLPGVVIVDDPVNQRIYWSAPETDQEIGSYMLYRNGQPMRDISDTYISYQDAGFGLIQIKVLYLFGGASELSNVIRRAQFPTIDSVHIGNDGFVSFVPPVGDYSGYISGYSVFYSDNLTSDDRSNEIQITDNTFTLPSSCTFVIVTHYQFGDSAASRVFQYNQDLNYNLLNGISSGIDNLTGGMNQIIGGYEKPTVPVINPPIDEYSEFANDMIDSLDKLNYRADHFASNFSPYLTGFSFWGSIFDDLDDQEPIHDMLMIWASLAIFSLLFGGIVVSIVSSRPRPMEERYQTSKIGFTAPVQTKERKAGFR